MTDSAVKKLRDAFANAAKGPVVLNAAFWTQAGSVPPAGFDALLKAAYRLAATAAGLSISYERGAVTAATDAGFQIDGVVLTFLDAPQANTRATLYVTPGTPYTPRLAIDVVPKGWQLADQFTAMNPVNWPFTLLAFEQQRFCFASAPQPFTWSGQTLALSAGQNLYGITSVPTAISRLFPVLPSLPAVGPTLVIGGAISLDKVDNETIQLPDMQLSALLSGQDLALFFINVSNPRLSFAITTTQSEIPSEVPGQPAMTLYFQPPSYGLDVDLLLQGADGHSVGMTLSAAASLQGNRYRFNARPLDRDAPVTPAAMIQLMGEGFFNLVPPVLQQYLASVQLLGFSVTGPLQPTPSLSALSAQIGSVQGQPIPLFSDPTTGAVFQLDEFSLAWTIANPLTKAQRQTSGTLVAAFKLFPQVFRTKDDKPGGLFRITLDQDLNFGGTFAGRASLDDILDTITGGAIGLPDGMAVSFSDIYLKASPSQKSYGLGFQVDADISVPFVQYTDPLTGEPKPLIQIENLVFDLAASTPNRSDGQPGKSVYAGSMVGQIIIGPLAANVSVAYDGTQPTPLWTLDTSLVQPLVLSDLIAQFLHHYDLPSFLPGTLTVEALAIHASIPVTPKALLRAQSARARVRTLNSRHAVVGWRSAVRPVAHPVRTIGIRGALSADQGSKSAYSILTRIRWTFDLTPQIPVDILAELGLNYDGNRKADEQFSGSVIGTVDIDLIGPVQIGYRFGAQEPSSAVLALPAVAPAQVSAALATNSVLWMSWKGFRAQYSFDDQTVAFSLTGWTVGSLITALMEMLGDPYFSLPDPWSVLNSISLNGFSIVFDLKNNAKSRVSAKYTLPSPISLGFLTVKGLQFLQVDGKVTLAIDGSTSIPGLNNQPLFNPAQGGQDVTQMPPVPGQGNAYFDLKLLMLGQRVAISGAPSFKTTQEVIKALTAVPASSGPCMPFDPSAQTPGQPYYNRSSNWLGALHFGLLRIGDTANYAIDFMVVFNDPDLYGLRLTLNGDKVKVLAGLAIDVLYKKVTDDIGCYQIEFTLPSVLRNLDFGAFSITLPVIALQIYTNGDFLVDFGFPYNMDFSRSFTVQAIILGMPVLGAGGFYFGKLSNATAPNLPATTQGTFHPVIVFGLGAQLGIGRYIDKGILKAGFSITVFGVIEGTLAAWHPYQIGNTGSANQVQGDYYFKLSGTFGVIGKLYGSIDFAIIKADVSLTVMVYVKIEYESFRKIPLTLSASVNVSVSIKIDLGLFSIRISLSFSASITEQLTIGSDSLAPWDGANTLAGPVFAMGKSLIESRALPLPRTLHEHGITGRAFTLDVRQAQSLLATGDGAEGKVPLEITAITQFTVLAPEGADYAQQEGALVLLFAMDAPVVGHTDQHTDTGGDTSFGRLCKPLLPWLVASLKPRPGQSLDALPAVAQGSVSRQVLEGILLALSDPGQAPFTEQQLWDFLAANFVVTVSAADAGLQPARKAQLDTGSTIFPALSFLSMAVPDPNAASGTSTIHYDNYVMATPAYQAELRTIFNSVAANVAAESAAAPKRTRAAAQEDNASLAASVFTDYFILLARQLVQSAMDVFDDYPYPLTAKTSLAAILDWANTLLNGQLNATPLAQANLNYPLSNGLKLDIANIGYMVQTQDTLASVAARYADPQVPTSTTAAALILANPAQTNLIAPKVQIQLSRAGVTKTYTTQVGDDFNSLALAFGLTLEQLSAETSLYTRVGLLNASVVMTVPNVTVATTAGDTIASVIARLSVPLENFLTPANLALEGLFKVDPSLRFAVPGLIVLPTDQVWLAILATGTLGQTAGTAARYMLHGMRLPVAPGLTIPASGFLYGAPHWTQVQRAYGVYQLTGQQFPLAERDAAYPITLARPDDNAHAWLTLGTGTDLTFDIGAQASLLTKVVGSAQKNGYKPQVQKLLPEAQSVLSPTRYGVANTIPWLTSDMASLLAVTETPSLRTGNVSAAAGPQVKPLLFGLSSALLAAIEAKQAVLASAMPDASTLLSYMPVLSPSVGTSNPATSQTTFCDIEDYAFATRIDFRIKQLAQDADLAPERPDANSVVPPGPGNPGSPKRALARFAYEVIGPNPSEAVLLERLLTRMASEGEALVSGLFLLYADVNNGAKGLTSRADSEFLSFIVQSNLSTETNPPQSGLLRSLATAVTPPTGIANTPAEFIKLLWELSTVNSGGTYLFYQLVADGTGLPAALFDESGIATLTLVATLRRDDALAKGTRIFNAVNALVTTATIDPQSSVIQLSGVSAPVASQTLGADASIAGITDLYGIDIAGLVASNPDALLASGKQVPLSGLYHQLLPADFGADKDPIGALAAYYSVGAVQPITAEAIADFNPGVPVAALSVFRIPPFTYTVTAAGPGNTLASMARYYQTECSVLGYAARNVAGLFQQPTVLIDPVALDAMSNLGRTNAGLSLERVRGTPPASLPDNPTQAQIDAYTQATLLQLYQMLSARIVSTPFFTASADTAAFGPKDPPVDGLAPRARLCGTAFVAASPDAPYLYNQALGFARQALINPAPANPPRGLPAASLNPYIGIGMVLQVGLDWQDLFGNRTATPFSHPQALDPQPFGNVPMVPTYSDRLLPLDAWPSTTRSYRYRGEGGAPVLGITLAFDPTPYLPATLKSQAHLNAVRLGDELPIWQRNAKSDLATFQLVYFQLNQNYDGLGVAGLAGPAVSLSLVNSLLATPEQPLAEAERRAILGYVNAVILYLSARANGTAGVTPTAVQLTIAVDINALTRDSDITRLALALRLTRQAELVSPALRALRDGVSVITTIPVDASQPKSPVTDEAAGADAPAYPVGLTAFAEDFERAFVGAGWRMRLGTSSADPATPSDTRTPTVWAVRMAIPDSATPEGIGFHVEDQPCYFAPLPIASHLQTLQVGVNPYQSGAQYPAGTPIPTTFTNVDPNVWLAECLTAVDDTLSAAYSTPLFQLDRLLGLNENPREPNDPMAGYLFRLLQYKKTLASAISATATPVLDQQPHELKAAAQDKLEQALLRRLSNANSLTCVAVFPVAKANYAPLLPPGVTAPRLFGQPTGNLGGSEKSANDNFALSTAKIPLNSTPGVDTSTLAFLVTSRSAETEAFVDLKLAYSLTHIEHDIQGVPGIEGYEQSRWVTFLTGPYTCAIAPVAIPVALRALPVPPTVVAQTGLPSYPDSARATPAQLKTWNYAFSFLQQQAAQDSIIANVVFNNDPGNLLGARSTAHSEALYTALAQFVAIYPAVARDLESYLRPIDGKTEPNSQDVALAACAIAALDSVLASVATAYDRWARAQSTVALAVEPSHKVEYAFEIRLVPVEGSQAAQVQILPQSFSRSGVPTDNFLPLAKVLIDADNYEPTLVSADRKTGAAVWAYVLRKDARDPSLPARMPYETARLDAARRVEFAELDLFALQNGWSSVQVTRNRHLAPDPAVKTTPAFEFTSAVARFADAMVPLLNVGTVALDQQVAAAKPIATWLEAFFTDLLTPLSGLDRTLPVLLGIQSSYAYSLVPGVTPDEVAQTVLPVSLLVPTSTEGSTNPVFVSQVGDADQDWLEAAQPLQDASAGFQFGVMVFSGTGSSSLPLMKINAITLAAASIGARKA